MSNGNFSIKKILILVTILAVPGFLYYLLSEKGKNRYKPLGIYGPKELSGSFHKVKGENIPDTLYHTIRGVALIDQDNNSVNVSVDTSHITVFNFFFSRCTSFCSHMNEDMGGIAKLYSTNKMVNFVSITVDPDYDTPPVLKKYSQKYHINSNKWKFLTGNKSDIYRLARESFLVDAFKDSTQLNNFIHSPKMILVDPERRIRGYYDSGDKVQVEKLVDEIKLQITEELRKIK
ncbi:MAG: electron transport protein SCO1/SenC [Sphingobacteriales bacterium]|nr:electron transport protein SCO1/SenC [Sphingobacteriales bacterium]